MQTGRDAAKAASPSSFRDLIFYLLTLTIWTSSSIQFVHFMPVIIAEGFHPIPSRTRSLSLPAPMVLHGRLCGRVGHRRHPVLPPIALRYAQPHGAPSPETEPGRCNKQPSPRRLTSTGRCLFLHPVLPPIALRYAQPHGAPTPETEPPGKCKQLPSPRRCTSAGRRSFLSAVLAPHCSALRATAWGPDSGNGTPGEVQTTTVAP